MTRLRVRPTLLFVVVALVFALPGSAAAAGGQATKLAKKACVDEKRSIGNKAFSKRYGDRNAIRTCVRKMRSEARRAIEAATAECQAELDDFGPEDFFEDYDSFEQCVTDLAEDSLVTDPVDEIGEDEGGEDL